jgi:hypothetical protein
MSVVLITGSSGLVHRGLSAAAVDTSAEVSAHFHTARSLLGTGCEATTMATFSARATTVLLAVLVSAAIGCQPTGDEGEDTSTGDDELVARVLGDVAEVRPDRLVFPKRVFPQKLRARIDGYRRAIASGKSKDAVENVLLVSDRQKDAVDASGKIKTDVGNPYGYMRRALSYADDGSKTVVMTEPASIEEVFEEIDANGQIEVGRAAQDGPGQLAPQVAKKFAKQIPIIELDGTELYDTLGAKVRIKQGSVVLKTTIDLSAEVAFFKMKKAHVIVDADIDSVFELEVRTERGLQAGFAKDVFKGRWPVGAIGPIPVTAGLTASVSCDLDVGAEASVSAGARASVQMRGGVRYARETGAEPTSERPTFDPGFITPSFQIGAATGIVCRLEPRIEVLLYDVIGPTVTPVLSATMKGSVPPPTLVLSAGLDLKVGGALEVFGKNLGEIDRTVFSTEKQLWTSAR